MELHFSNSNNSEIWSGPFLPFCRGKNQIKDGMYIHAGGGYVYVYAYVCVLIRLGFAC